MPDDLPDDVRRFLLVAIDSVPHLEALLLLHRNREATWTARRAAEMLYIGEAQAGEMLDRLRSAGFLSASGREELLYTYSPRSPEQGALVDRLALAYAKNLIEVTRLIHEKPVRKVQQFADAFRMRKE